MSPNGAESRRTGAHTDPGSGPGGWERYGFTQVAPGVWHGNGATIGESIAARTELQSIKTLAAFFDLARCFAQSARFVFSMNSDEFERRGLLFFESRLVTLLELESRIDLSDREQSRNRYIENVRFQFLAQSSELPVALAVELNASAERVVTALRRLLQRQIELERSAVSTPTKDASDFDESEQFQKVIRDFELKLSVASMEYSQGDVEESVRYDRFSFGPTISDLIEAADISESTFGRIRRAAGIETEQGRAAASRIYTPREVAAMIEAARKGSFACACDVATAWAQWTV